MKKLIDIEDRVLDVIRDEAYRERMSVKKYMERIISDWVGLGTTGVRTSPQGEKGDVGMTIGKPMLYQVKKEAPAQVIKSGSVDDRLEVELEGFTIGTIGNNGKDDKGS